MSEGPGRGLKSLERRSTCAPVILALMLELGGVFHYVGDRFNGLDNSVRLLGYGRTDAFAAWTIDRYRLTARVRNLFDADYANWGSQFYTTQVSLGAPRSAEIELGFRF